MASSLLSAVDFTPLCCGLWAVPGRVVSEFAELIAGKADVLQATLSRKDAPSTVPRVADMARGALEGCRVGCGSSAWLFAPGWALGVWLTSTIGIGCCRLLPS